MSEKRADDKIRSEQEVAGKVEPASQGEDAVLKPDAKGKEKKEKKEKKPKGQPLPFFLASFDDGASAEWCYVFMEQLCEQIPESLGEKRKVHGSLRPERVWVQQIPQLMDILELGESPPEEKDEKRVDESNENESEHASLWIEPSAYTAPEVKFGEEADGRADVYSLGVLLYAMLTGAPPKTYPPPPIAEVRPDLEIFDGLDKVICVAMEREPDDRHQSIQLMLEALQAAREAAKAPKGINWSKARKKIKKKLIKYMRKRFEKLMFKELKGLLKYKAPKNQLGQAGQQAGKQAAQEVSKQAAKQAAKQVVKQAAQEGMKSAAQAAASSASSAASVGATSAAKAGVMSAVKATAMAAVQTAGTAATVAAQGAVLAAGVVVGASGGAQGVAAVSQIPVVKHTIQKMAPSFMAAPVPRPQGVAARVVSTPDAGPPDAGLPDAAMPERPPEHSPERPPEAKTKGCPKGWISLEVDPDQKKGLIVTLEKGRSVQVGDLTCLPPNGENVIIDRPGYVQCSLALVPKTKALKVRLQRDRAQILLPNYCLKK